MKKGECPNCYYVLQFSDDLILGEVVECPDCSLTLEVAEITGEKVVLRKGEMEEEDWGE